MALDSRISLLGQQPKVSQAINIFENALMNNQTRDIRQQQADQQALLNPLQLQQQQQNIDINKQAIGEGRQQQILKSVNDFALGNRSLIQNAQSTGDFTGLRNAMLQRREQLIQQNLPTETTDEGIALIDAGQGGQVISALGDSVNLFNQQQGRGKSAATRDFETKVNLVKNDPELKTPAAKAAAIDLGLEARASTSAQERIASDPVLTDAVAQSTAQIAEAKSEATEGAKLKQQLKHKPAITRAIKLAEKAAIEQGEVLTDLARAEAGLPGLIAATNNLKELSRVATSTFGGRFFDVIAKESGWGSTKGANARAKYIAIIDNQVLPLLKQTFGAAMTEGEGLRLSNTLGDANASPEQKMLQTEAFIEQKLRDIERLKSQASAGAKAEDELINVSDEDLFN